MHMSDSIELTAVFNIISVISSAPMCAFLEDPVLLVPWPSAYKTFLILNFNVKYM